MNSTTKRALFFLLTGTLLMSACQPAAAPTQDPAEIQQQIDEAVALTVAAQNEATEQALAALPTNTPLPTQTSAVSPTDTPVIPTATPFVVVPPTATSGSSGSSGGGGSAPVPADYACTSQDRRPYDNTYFKPGNEFDINWTIVNTGTKSWPAGMDVKYFSGPHISKTTIAELPAMAPGDKYVVVLDGVAPSKKGFHVETWIVEGQLCFPYVAINVE
jgi:hypothetical protein